jgi:predicted extracellular nuclease
VHRVPRARLDAVAETDEAFTITATLGASSQQASATITNDDGVALTLISAIQGSALASPLVGQTVTVEAIVVGDFQSNDSDTARNLNGFWLQEEATDSDGNVLTSEGIFVLATNLPVDVKVGDKVQVTGVVAETFGNTELNASSVTIVEAGAVADVDTMAAAVDLPTLDVQTASNGTYTAALERYEGMLVSFPETLTITEQFNLDQFGEIRLTQGPRPSSYTVNNEPSVSGFDAHIRDVILQLYRHIEERERHRYQQEFDRLAEREARAAVGS